MRTWLIYPTAVLSVTLFLASKSTGATFSDAEGHVYQEAIRFVQEEDIVQGYADGTFRPDASINRAEFVKILVEAALLDETGANCFPDVRNQWFARFVCTAKDKGFVGGYPDGTFKPDRSVQFAEAAKIISIAFDLPTETNVVWYVPFVDALRERNAVPPSITHADQKLTRGEMAAMIYALNADAPEALERSESGESDADEREWQRRVDAAFAPSDCPRVSGRRYGDTYYVGPLIDSHYHIATIPDHTPEELEGHEGAVDPLLGVNLTITDIVCTLTQENTSTVFAFFPVYEEVSAPMLAVAKRAMEQYPMRFVPFIMPPDHDDDPQGSPTVDAEVLGRMLDVHSGLWKGYGEIGLYERTGGGSKELPPDAQRLLDLYPVIQKHKLAVYFHLGEGHKEHFERVLEQNPAIHFIWHGDQLITYENGRQNLQDVEDIIRKHPNVSYTVDELYGDEFLINPQHTKEQFLEHLENYEALLQEDLGTWKAIIENYPDQFMWGTDRSDQVVWSHDPDVGQALANYARAFIARLSPAVQEKFAYKNAERLFPSK